MTVNETLAQASNAMVYGSMTAFTGAMVAFSVSLAKGPELKLLKFRRNVPVHRTKFVKDPPRL